MLRARGWMTLEATWREGCCHTDLSPLVFEMAVSKVFMTPLMFVVGLMVEIFSLRGFNVSWRLLCLKLTTSRRKSATFDEGSQRSIKVRLIMEPPLTWKLDLLKGSPDLMNSVFRWNIYLCKNQSYEFTAIHFSSRVLIPYKIRNRCTNSSQVNQSIVGHLCYKFAC